MVELAVYWLTEEDCIQLIDNENFVPAFEGLPEYMQNQIMSRYGRPGRGRIWIDKQFDVKSMWWWDNESPYANDARDCGGIVIHMKDTALVRDLPGFLTDINLKSIQYGS